MEAPDFEQSKEVKIEDCTFLIRHINHKTFRRITRRLSINPLLKKAVEDKQQFNDIEKLIETDPARFEAEDDKLEQGFEDLVRHGVCGHSGIKRNGKDVSFEFETGYEMVSEKTIELYHQLGILFKLAGEVLALNSQSEDERKN